MKVTFGSYVRTIRSDMDKSRAAIAKKLGITKEFLGHLECDAPVHLSEKLELAIMKKLPLSAKERTQVFPALVKSFRARRTRWCRAQKKKRKPARKTAKRKARRK